jgi:hypothetical protein
VAGPEEVDFAVAVLGVEVRAVNPRSSYLRGRHAGRDFHALDRMTLSHALEYGRVEWGPEATARSIDVLAPDAVCLRKGRGDEVADLLLDRGYDRAGVDGTCRFFVRSVG